MNYKLCAFADEASNSFDGQIKALLDNGLSYLEIRNLDGKNVADLSITEAKELRARLEDKGLGVWSVGSRLGKIGIRDSFAPHLDELSHTLELADTLGCNKIRMFSFYIPEGEAPEIYRDEVMERLTRFTDTAKGSGIKLCHENEKGIYGDTAERCLDVLKNVPKLGAVFDPANFVQCGEDTLRAWELLEKHIVYMHIKDSLADGRIVPAGKGEGNVPKLLERYEKIGGSVLTLEPHLFIFEGLQSLEKREIEKKDFPYEYATPELAFAAACAALREYI